MTVDGSCSIRFPVPPCRVRFARLKAIGSKTDLNEGQIAGCHGSPNVVDCLAGTSVSIEFFAAAFSDRGEKCLQSGKFIAHEPG